MKVFYIICSASDSGGDGGDGGGGDIGDDGGCKGGGNNETYTAICVLTLHSKI